MVLRIVSGVISPNVRNGNVTIELKTNTIVGGAGNANIWNTNEFGGSTHYDKEPCSALSIRQFSGQPSNIGINGPTYQGPTTHYENVKIYWYCSNDGYLEEITYFFAGEE